MDGRELRESVVNKFVAHENDLYEIRSDRKWRLVFRHNIIKNNLWQEDEPIDDEYSWESIIKGGAVKVIDLKEWMEKNFEKLL